MKSSSRFFSNALIYSVLQEKIQPYTSNTIIRTALNIYISKKIVSFVSFKEIMKFQKLWQMKIEIGSYKRLKMYLIMLK